MKPLLFFTATFLVAIANGQSGTLEVVKGEATQFKFWSYNNDCGTWQPDTTYYTDWETVDTIGSNKILGEFRGWVYDGVRLDASGMVPAVYCPCGCGWDTTWTQYRVCPITGIRQKRTKVQRYKYIQPPKSDYEKTIDELNSKN